MSFSLTTEQVRLKVKTLTRRMGWKHLKPGDLVRAIKKGQGLKKGEKVESLALIRIVSVKREQLIDLLTYPEGGYCEVKREGFGPGYGALLPGQFILYFMDTHTGCNAITEITRIEFEYI